MQRFIKRMSGSCTRSLYPRWAARSGNIIKNVKSVIVPHTGGRKGIPVAVAAGVRVGDADAQLEVLANVTQEQLPLLDELGDAMDARCYSGSKVRTKYKKLTFTWRDFVGLFVCAALLAGVILLRVYLPNVI